MPRGESEPPVTGAADARSTVTVDTVPSVDAGGVDLGDVAPHPANTATAIAVVKADFMVHL